MMDVNELEAEIKKGKEDLVSLEVLYEKEEDENKINKLEFRMAAKEEAINKLIDRQQKLLEREAEDAQEDNGKDKNVEEDEDVCPECGGDLNQVGEENGVAIFECVRCKELFLDK